MGRVKTDKIVSVCKCCQELKEDHFSNGFCLPCNRVEQLINLYRNNVEGLKESIRKDEEVLNTKKLILSGIHPITKKDLHKLKTFHCFKEGQYIGKLQGLNKRDAFQKLPDIQEIRNQKAWDSQNNEYILISIKN